MRRDICHFYEKSVKEVYLAYREAAALRFNKISCREAPYHTLTFGLNYSIRYGMSGGACTVHFMPFENGTAVDVRYSIAQAFGARYGAFDRDLTYCVERILGVYAKPVHIHIAEFMREQNRVYAEGNPSVYRHQPRTVVMPKGVIMAKKAPAAAAPESNDTDCGKITVMTGSMKGAKLRISDGSLLKVGKDPAFAHLVFDSSYFKVSRQHCTITYESKYDKYFVTDCSANGTFFENGQRLEKGKRTPVHRGTLLKLADDRCMIRFS